MNWTKKFKTKMDCIVHIFTVLKENERAILKSGLMGQVTITYGNIVLILGKDSGLQKLKRGR